MAPRYPVLLDLRDQPCLVVGAGAVAGRKVSGLLDVGARVTVLAPRASGELRAAVDAGRLRWEPRAFATEDLPGPLPGWRLVIAATDDTELNHRVASLASDHGIWANDASSVDGGAAALPAVHRRGPITLTASTGGIHPGAAGWLRDLVAAAVGPEHVTALVLADEVRAGSPAGSRPDWREAVDSGMLDLIREGHLAEAKERLQACLSSSSD